MAITIDDFSKIWASTSPLTPYEFSENNYKQGWNFVGGTPPSRQMWDFLQKNNDEKMQYLADNYLPLSGGTMTGEVKKAGLFACAGVDNSAIRIVGGSGGENTGSQLKLFGKDDSSNAGKFQIFANDGTYSVGLVGHPNGRLTWDGNNVITDEVKTYTPTLTSNFELYDSSANVNVLRAGNVVNIIGSVKPKSEIASGQNTTMFTIPVGYRPTRNALSIMQGSGINRWLLDVGTNGNVRVSRYGTSSETAIPQAAWLPFSVTYITTDAFPS